MGNLRRDLSMAGVGAADASGSAFVQRVGVVEGALGAPERLASMAALFPQVSFESVGPAWPQKWDASFDVLIVALAGGSAEDLQEAIRRLKTRPSDLRIVVALRDADVTTTRQLIREGAADVLPAPVSEAAVALCLERLFVRDAGPSPSQRRRPNEVAAFLKAGGGVGATALAVQVAGVLAARGTGQICLADLDLQYGAAALYFDMPEAVTIADLMSAKTPLADAPLGSALATHRSGARLLAAPRDLVALETLNAAHADGLVKGLRREFALTLVDLPPAWTAWTNQILTAADRIVMVTQLSVPHIQLVKRQLRVLAAQRLDDRPLILVCNALSREQQASVSLKAAEKALGRPFDVVIPEDRRLMNSAINQGVELSALRRGAKIEKAIGELADKVGAGAMAMTDAGAGKRR
jgi:pilus assembly protein CpaE